MKKLVFQMKQLVNSNHDGSFDTRKKREEVLLLAARQLSNELGYHNMQTTSLKPKHIDALVKLWRNQNLSVSTLKARMSHLRWWAKKVNKQNVIARKNEHYGIGKRHYVTGISKARNVEQGQIDAIKDNYVRMSVKLAKAFGLRKEEAIKFVPSYADQGDRIRLKASWCKGGREREVPILTKEQRLVLDEAKYVAGNGSLIPVDRKYHQQRSRYEAITRLVNLKKLHGLRHRYAQIRYREITGWECPHRGGPKRKDLDKHRREIDREARLIISRELGHNRIEIVANYLG